MGHNTSIERSVIIDICRDKCRGDRCRGETVNPRFRRTQIGSWGALRVSAL